MTMHVESVVPVIKASRCKMGKPGEVMVQEFETVADVDEPKPYRLRVLSASSNPYHVRLIIEDSTEESVDSMGKSIELVIYGSYLTKAIENAQGNP